jgi:hypothetical protein
MPALVSDTAGQSYQQIDDKTACHAYKPDKVRPVPAEHFLHQGHCKRIKQRCEKS